MEISEPGRGLQIRPKTNRLLRVPQVVLHSSPAHSCNPNCEFPESWAWGCHDQCLEISKYIMNEWMNDTWNTWLPLASSMPQTNPTQLFPGDKIFICLWQNILSHPLPQWALPKYRQGLNKMNHASVNKNGPHGYKIWTKAFKSIERMRKNRFACVWQWMWVTEEAITTNPTKPVSWEIFTSLSRIYRYVDGLFWLQTKAV